MVWDLIWALLNDLRARLKFVNLIKWSRHNPKPHINYFMFNYSCIQWAINDARIKINHSYLIIKFLTSAKCTEKFWQLAINLSLFYHFSLNYNNSIGWLLMKLFIGFEEEISERRWSFPKTKAWKSDREGTREFAKIRR